MSTVLAGLCIQSAVADQSIEDFTLGSHRGVEWSLDDVADHQLVVVAFLGTECPLAKLYGPRLTELQKEYEDKGVAFVGINANTQDSLAEITAYVTEHKISFPMLKDVGSRIADQFKAERTPEVFLLDKKRTVRYHGRIDDQYLIGLSRYKVKRRDLAVAIDELLTGKSVSVSHTEPIGCHIGRPSQVEPHGDITYSKDIAAIFNSHCVECHRKGEVAPFALTSYEDVIGWEETILEVIRTDESNRTKDRNLMPPWYASSRHKPGVFSNDVRLTEQEKRLLEKWVENGMPEGDRSQLPSPPQFVEGWKIGEPDDVKWMRDPPVPFNVAANSVVEYQYFEVPGWNEDKYVTAMEARPDNTSVVHHIIAYIIPPGEKDDEQKKKNKWMLVGYAPGATPRVMAEGTAMHVPAGSTLLFEMHYTPNGTVQTDLSYIGVKFTEKENVTKLFRGGGAVNGSFEIPAGAVGVDPAWTYKADDWASEENRSLVPDREFKPDEGTVGPEGRPHHAPIIARHRIRQNQMLLDMTPHMHLRGTYFKYVAMFPKKYLATLSEADLARLEITDGTKMLLEVPNYDFNWQLTYKLAKPLLLPKDTVIYCEASFDNSEDNLALRDTEPEDEKYHYQKDVRWGRQSWHEMMIGFFSTRDPYDHEMTSASTGGADNDRTGD
ncbi:MAG: thioredoxin family protein [Fuerstiella sp.]|nr:redoxin domain-containing protein [Fuerstiella sp.]